MDFDQAGPGDRLNDMAYALEYSVPFRDGAQAMRWQGFATPPSRARRIAVFAEEYGLDGVEGLVSAVIACQGLTAVHVRSLAEQGIEPQRTWVADGFLNELAARARWSTENRSLFE